MSAIHCAFFLSQFIFTTDNMNWHTTNDILMFSLYLIAFISSILSLVIFTYNFEKCAIYPSYFENDNLSQIKYIFPHLYLYPSTKQIYAITNNNNNKQNDNNNTIIPPPTCHYPTNIGNNIRPNNHNNNNNNTLSSSSDIFTDDNNITNNKHNTFILFLCKFTFSAYLFCDFACRISPFILSFVQLYVSIKMTQPDNIQTYIKSQWLFWINCGVLIVFTAYLMAHFTWLHRKYSDFHKPSAPFWRYTIKKYLKCHYIHPLRSILDTEPLFAFILRNCLFWFCVLIICNISILGLIFNRATLYSPKVKKWGKIRKRVEASIIRESLIRYFLGFVIILLMVIFDSFYDNKQFYFVAVWTFIYCIFALFCSFIVLKISRSSLFRIDGMWIDRIRKRGWILSRNEEGLMWHRNYNKAQSYIVKKIQKKQRMQLMQRQNKMYQQRKIMNHTHNQNDDNNNNTDEISSSNDGEKEAAVQLQRKKSTGVIPMVGLSQEIMINNHKITSTDTGNASNANEQQIKSSGPSLPKTPKQNDCSNDTIITITENINIINNIKINDNLFDNNSITNTTVNSSNINVKISCINPSNIISTYPQTLQKHNTNNSNTTLTNSNHKSLSKKSNTCTLSSQHTHTHTHTRTRPKPSILRTTTTTCTNVNNNINNNISPLNNMIRPCSSEPPPSTSTQRSIADHMDIIRTNTTTNPSNATNNNTILAALSTSPPHYPPPQLSMYAINAQHPHSHPNIFHAHTHARTRSQSLSFEDKHIALQSQPIHTTPVKVNNNGNNSSSHSSQRRIMLLDEEQSDESSNNDIVIIHPKQLCNINYNEQIEGKTNTNDRDVEIFRQMLQKQHEFEHEHERAANNTQITPQNTDIFTPNSNSFLFDNNNNMQFDPFSESSISTKPNNSNVNTPHTHTYPFHIKNGFNHHRNITTPELNDAINEHKTEHTQMGEINIDNNKIQRNKSNSSPKKNTQMVTIKWPHGGGNGNDNTKPYNKDFAIGSHVHNPRLSWSESDIKYPLKWLMNQQKSKNKQKKKIKRQLKSINNKKERKQKIANSFKKHSKITLQPMDENMDTEFSSKRSSVSKSKSKKKSLSSLSNSSRKISFQNKNKKRKHFSLSTNDGLDMGSIDEIGALMHQSSDSSTSDTMEFNHNNMSNIASVSNISSPPKSKSISIGHTPLSFDEINSEINTGKTSRINGIISMDSALSINIQNTNTKLFDTLRKLSTCTATGTQQNSKGNYQNIPSKIRHRENGNGNGTATQHIICDNSSDDSMVDIKIQVPVYKKKKYNHNHNHKNNMNGAALLAQSYTHVVGNERRRAISSSREMSSKDCEINEKEKLNKHRYKNSDTIHTMSTVTPTVTQSFLNVTCNIDDQ